MEAVVAGEADQRPVVDDVAPGILAQDRGLHPVIEDLARHASERSEGGEMTAQHGLQVLVQDEASPEQAAVAEHQGEQPNDPGHPGSSANATWNWAKSTCAWSPGRVSKRTSKTEAAGGRSSRSVSVTAV
jgi:hypothetical protein